MNPSRSIPFLRGDFILLVLGHESTCRAAIYQLSCLRTSVPSLPDRTNAWLRRNGPRTARGVEYEGRICRIASHLGETPALISGRALAFGAENGITVALRRSMNMYLEQVAGFGWMEVTVSLARIGVIAIVFRSAVHSAVTVHSLFGTLKVAPYEDSSR